MRTFDKTIIMEKSSLHKNASALTSDLQKHLANIADKPANEKIVLHDECGDTLWDEVLAQDENKTATKKQTLPVNISEKESKQ
jgi:hypothetical protein